jgi:hypothetical protein
MLLECGGRHGSAVCQPFDARPVRDLGAPPDGVGDVQHLVPVLQRLHGGEGEADLGVQRADDQPLAPGRLHRLAEGLILERVH